jgi:hypothetical protein
MATNERIAWLASGLVVGAVIVKALKAVSTSSVIPLRPTASVWRLNTMTGALDVCVFGGQCTAMPAPGR